MEYLLKVSIAITIFYACYKVFLERETFFKSNRWFLLIGLLSSFLIPFIVIPIYIEYASSLTLPTLSKQVLTGNIKKTTNLLDYLPMVYGFGVVCLIIRFFIQLSSLINLIYNNIGIKKEQYIFIKTKDAISPFSFFKWIVYNSEKFHKKELEQIIVHEKVHAKQYHSIDILITQICCIVLWFNPFIWFYTKELKKNLEFIADNDTLKLYNCKKSYQYTLLKSNISNRQMALSNHFYNSLIKKRIIMLQKSKSKKINQFKYALVIPFLVIFLISCNSENTENLTNSTKSAQLSPSFVSAGTYKDAKDTPLIFIDDKEISLAKMNDINPDNIEAFHVLKDESATKIYGDKGKYGVILITTKETHKVSKGKPVSTIKVNGYDKSSDSPITITEKKQ